MCVSVSVHFVHGLSSAQISPSSLVSPHPVPVHSVLQEGSLHTPRRDPPRMSARGESDLASALASLSRELGTVRQEVTALQQPSTQRPSALQVGFLGFVWLV